jgi:Fic family protein
MERLTIIRSILLEEYKKEQKITILKHFNKIKKLPFDKSSFGYSASMASVFSSMIEGNRIDFDTFLEYSNSGMNTKSKSYKEIEVLIKAYEAARGLPLTYTNFLKSHATLSKTLITEAKYRGKIRDKAVYIYSDGVRIYTGASAEVVSGEMVKLFNDIDILLKRDTSITETFYYASMIHLILAKIHPFADGNGRASRLLEKWFLAQKLGENAWFIPSEKLYQTRIKSYYNNIHIGHEYSTVNYNAALPFLLMLPMALKLRK